MVKKRVQDKETRTIGKIKSSKGVLLIENCKGAEKRGDGDHEQILKRLDTHYAKRGKILETDPECSFSLFQILHFSRRH